MAVQFDVFNAGAGNTGNISFTHTPTGTPRGVLVFIRQGDAGANTDQVTSVTYGGVGMTEVTESPVLHTGSASSDDSAVYVYFLGSSIPTGAQTVFVTVSGSNEKRASCITLTADDDTEISSSDGIDFGTSVTDPSHVLELGGKVSFVSTVFMSGRSLNTEVGPLTSWTVRTVWDFSDSVGGIFTYDIIGSSDVTCGWTQATADDASCISVGVTEVAPAGGSGSGYLIAGYRNYLIR